MPDPSTYTIGWICAVMVEFVAAQLFLDEEHEELKSVHQHDTNAYKLGKIKNHNVVIAVLPDGEYGIAAATAVARNLLLTFKNVRVGVMVGIGGGAPRKSHDIRLGDIVVSSPENGRGGVLQFDLGKSIQGGKFRPTGFLNQPPTTIRSALMSVRADLELGKINLEEDIQSILKSHHLKDKYSRPDPDCDKLYKSNVEFKPRKCFSSADLVVRPKRSASQQPMVHYGLIASSNQVMKDAHKRDEIAEKENVLCFEMEAAGLMNHFPCMVIRGICDYSDSHKNDNWQPYAAMAAAAFGKALVKRINPVELDSEQSMTSNIIVQVKKTQQKLAQYRHLILCQQLKHADQAAYDSFGAQADFPLTPTTRIEVIDSIETWANEENDRRIYWLSGMAGTGKSTICRDIARRFEAKGILGATFMFNRFDKSADNALLVMSTICRQLMSRISAPTLAECVEEELRKVDDICSKTIEQQFQTLIITPLKALHKDETECPGDHILLFDALDECAHKHIKMLVLLLSSLCDIEQKVHLKVFITSRPDNPVRTAFNSLDGSYTEFKLQEMSQTTIDRDIKTFLGTTMARIRDDWDRAQVLLPEDRLGSTWPTAPEIAELTDFARPLFIVAATACRFMDNFEFGSPKHRLRKFLDSARGHDAIDAAYMPILHQFVAIGETADPSEKEELFDLFRKVIGAVFLVEEPLSIRSIALLLDTRVGRIMKYLESVLIIPGNGIDPVKIFHASFRDYVLGNPPLDFRIDLEQTHRHIGLRCLEVLSTSLHYNMCKLKPADGLSAVSKEAMNQSFPSHVRYACAYWAFHIQRGVILSGDEEIVYDFLSSKLMFLLEALLILGERLAANETLERLIEVFRDRPQPIREVGIVDTSHDDRCFDKHEQLLELLEASNGFVAKNISTVAAYPLQLYWSALPFSPPDGLVPRLFCRLIPSTIRYTLPKSQLRPPFKIIRPGPYDRREILNAAVSPDNRFLALIDRNTTVHMWQIYTDQLMFSAKGFPLHKQSHPQPPGPYNPLAFTADSKYLLAGFHCKMHAYRPQSGMALAPILVCGQKHSHAIVTHIAASKNPMIFATAHSDHTAAIWSTALFSKLWEISIYALKEPPKAFGGPPTSFVSFSDTSDILVTTFGKKIRLWNSSTRETLGEDIMTNEDIVVPSTFITCPPKGTPESESQLELLLVRQKDGKVSALNLSSKEWEWENRVYDEGFKSMAIFPDGTKMVCDSYESDARFSVRSFSSGDILQALDLSSICPRQTVLSKNSMLPRRIMLSNDGQLLITLTDAFAVVWRTSDIESGKANLDFAKFIESRGSKAKRCFIHNRFPQGDQLLVSTHENGMVKVSIPETEEVLHVFHGDKNKLRHEEVFLSPDAKYIFCSECPSPYRGNTTYLLRTRRPQPAVKIGRFTNWVLDGIWLLLNKITGNPISFQPRHTHRVRASEGLSLVPWLERATVVFSPDSLSFAFANSHEFSIWTVRGGRKAHGGHLSAAPMGVTTDWKTAVYTVRKRISNDRNRSKWVHGIRVLNIEASTYIDLAENDMGFQILAVSPDSEWLGSTAVGSGGELSIWQGSTGARRTLVGHDCSVVSVIFSTDSARMITGDEKFIAKVWTTATGGCLYVLQVGRSLRQLRLCGDTQALITKFGNVRLPREACPDAAIDTAEDGQQDSTLDPDCKSSNEERTSIQRASIIQEARSKHGSQTRQVYQAADEDEEEGEAKAGMENDFQGGLNMDELSVGGRQAVLHAEVELCGPIGLESQFDSTSGCAENGDIKYGSEGSHTPNISDKTGTPNIEVGREGRAESNEEETDKEDQSISRTSPADEVDPDNIDPGHESSDEEHELDGAAATNQKDNSPEEPGVVEFPTQWQGYGIDSGGRWITWNGMRMMIMPKDVDAAAHPGTDHPVQPHRSFPVDLERLAPEHG